ncbi:YebC/PmpR family DNA-binding transcriptional regulator [Candidatus Peregrinibacteria bacterium]|nr:MAG: YebC/PmpR family DNA-binding transcriptional regulator [Candidatus Peregrinibacteria bacterium]
MSGHSKWHSIRHKKGLIDAQRGKIFTRHAHLITIAARRGGDPTTNPSLRLAIDNAKKANVPNSNIEKAVKNGTGESKDGVELFEVSYEGYGPEGVAVIVEALTDNKNRTYTNIRTLFNKKGGNLGASGSVSWMFQRKGVIEIKLENRSKDAVELAAIEAGAEDIKDWEETLEIITEPGALNTVNEALMTAGIESEKAEVLLIPNEPIHLETEEQMQKISDFIDAIEEDPDVTDVATNLSRD